MSRQVLLPGADFAGLTDFLCRADARALLENSHAIAGIIPELAPMLGFDQHSPHHAYDLYTHTALVTAAVPPEPVLRWAALLHDVGKLATFTRDETGRGHFKGHAQAGAVSAEAILRRLGAPEPLCSQAANLIFHHMTRLEADEKALSLLSREEVCRLIHLQEADMASKGIEENADLSQFARLRAMLGVCQKGG